MSDIMMPRPDSKLVMLVDDTPDNLKMLSDALDLAGYTVLVATDGVSAIERLDFIVPDIVLMDAVMPGMNGFETCQRFKLHPVANRIPIIFMTGLTEPEDVVRGFQAGGIDYVTKPIDVDVVLARLEAHLRNAGMVSAAMNAMDAAANAVVVLYAQGHVVWKTSKARLWLASYFQVPEDAPGLPETLAAWVAQHLSLPAQRDTPEFVQVQGAGMLFLRLTATRKSGEFVLLIEERLPPEDPAAALAIAYQLTAREQEVLLWLSKGKTNRDISDILGMSPRTVNKHLEHVYVKLGVETRAAATALVLTYLRSPHP